MKFFVQILFDAEGNEVGKGTTTYPTMDEAEKAFHVALSSAMGKDDIHKAIAIIFDDEGKVVMRRVWVKGK